MASLIAASVFFLLIHFGVSGTRMRDGLIARMGERPYRAAFGIASLAGTIWLVIAYRHAPNIVLWGQLISLRPLAYVVVLIAFLFVVIGVTTVNPTRVGMEAKLADGAAVVRGITRITRHPFLWGVALWALMHLIINGDLASLFLFGSLLLLALGGTASIDAKRRRSFPSQWESFARATSSVPFAAVFSGRNQLGPALSEIGGLKLLLAVVIYVVAFVIHGRLGHPLT
ncbi:MAG TPA: NnrU family protein [Steroidobacteraceae bacterium]|nr:NnrU family protein [Steroidobacteraceae bacterium]